jgi:glycoside/pentoside/hexuronide:cation symporter, GPH family
MTATASPAPAAGATASGRVALPRLMAFAAPSLPLAAMGLPFVVQLPPHYTSHVGIAAWLVGVIFMSARLIDIGVDLWVGLAMDQTRTRIGRFTPWLLAGAPLLSIGATFLFFAQPGASPIYLGLALLGSYIAFSMATLSQAALGATLSSDYNERARIFTWWQAGNIIGMLLVLALPVIVHQRGGSDAEGVHAMGWFVIILAPVSAVICALFAREQAPKAAPQPSSFADFRALVGLKSCRRLLLADLILMFSSGVTGGLFLFFFTAVKGYSGGDASLLLLVYFVTGLVAAPLWTLIARRTAKHVSLIVACFYAAVTQPLILFLPEGQVALAAAGMAVAGAVYAAPAYLLRAMMADVGDEDLLVTGKDRTGLLYAMVTLTGKAGYAFSVGITYVALSAFGFEARLGGDNTQQALTGLVGMFVAVPVLMSLVGAALLRGYPLDAARTAEVQAALASRGAGSAAGG